MGRMESLHITAGANAFSTAVEDGNADELIAKAGVVLATLKGITNKAEVSLSGKFWKKAPNTATVINPSQT